MKRSLFIFKLFYLTWFALILAGCTSGNGPRAAGISNLPAGSGVTVYAAGDIADCKHFKAAASGAAKTAEIVAAGLADDPHAAVLTLGDHTYPVGLLQEFNDCYDPTWGQFKSRTYPSPGNHEYYTPAAVGYYAYFGNAAGPARRGYYSFDLGKWHLVSLNSNLKGDEHLAQLAWLKADLAQHNEICTLAYWHHPVYSSGGHGNYPRMNDYWKALQAAGADLLLVSHDHDYERFAPMNGDGKLDETRGMREFVVGTGGARLTPAGWSRPLVEKMVSVFNPDAKPGPAGLKANSEIVDNSTHGVLKLVLKDTGYEWEFLPVAGGVFTDRGAALCH